MVEIVVGQRRSDQPPRVDTISRDQPLRRLAQVRRGVTEIASSVVAVHDLTTDLMRASEDLGRACDIARGKEVAHAAGGPTTPFADVLEGEHLEAVFGAEPAQRVDVAGVANTEPGVLAHDDHARAQRLDEHLDHEVLRGPLGELVGELHDQHGVQPGGREQVEALVGGGDDLRCPLRVQDGDRVRLEGDRDRVGVWPS